MRRVVLSILLLALSCFGMRAQFSLTGSDPSSVRWMRMDSPNFTLIYPAGEDSLARVYGSWLEKIGPRGRTPVILHSFNTSANASVTWAPRRMDMFTVMDPFNPTPIGWERLLAIHEGRHLAQMQTLSGGRNKVAGVVFGEMFTGALAGIFPGPTILEGDAVVAETAFTSSGRGRQSSFLSYMAPAFDSGDWRDYWRWSYGSFRLYTPDHYRTGYMLISGMRVFHDDPLFTERYFSRVTGKGLLFNLQKTVREGSGMSLKKTFRSISESYQSLWEEEAARRAPFMPSRQVALTPWRHTEYSGTTSGEGDEGLWVRMSGLTQSPSLVRLTPDGSEVRIRSFASSSSALALDSASGRVYWSESVPHWRWSLAGDSRIRFVETGEPSKIHDLTKKGKFFNPAPSPDGSLVCVTEYPASGGSRLVLLDAATGDSKKVIPAPDSLQFTESAWIGDRLFAAALSPRGMGIYEIAGGGENPASEPERNPLAKHLPVQGGEAASKPEGSSPAITKLLGPQPVELSYLRSDGEHLTFLCDRTGVSEMYSLAPDSGKLIQMTSTRYGISSPTLRSDTLYYSSLAPSDNPAAHKNGRIIYSTAASDLPKREVSFEDIHSYPIASTLTAQTKTLYPDKWERLQEYSPASFSQPRPFHRLTPTVHSWAPLYFNYDNLDSISGDDYYKSASAGATILFQNLVGDGYGFIGYGLHEDPDDRGLRHSGHFKYLYNGLIPVLELSADIGDRSAISYNRVRLTDRTSGSVMSFTEGKRLADPYFNGIFRVYVPINLTSGGISRGIVPQVKFKLSNDRFSNMITLREIVSEDGTKVVKDSGFLGEDRSALLTTLDLSVRGYIMRQKAPSQVYPRLGIGLEAGIHSRPRLSGSYSPTAYLYAYGYLPGILQNQGIKLTASVGTFFGGGAYSYPENPLSFVPRGFVDTNLRTVSNAFSRSRYRLTVDYAIPLLNLDWGGLCPVAYLKNLEVTPFYDYSYQTFDGYNSSGNRISRAYSSGMSSAGADIVLNLGNFLWIPYDSRLGLRVAFNSWSDLTGVPVTGLDRHYVGTIFDLSF